MCESTNTIQLNVRRTDELLSQLSTFPTRLGIGNTKQSLSSLDDLRASINSLDFKSPHSTKSILISNSQDHQYNLTSTRPSIPAMSPIRINNSKMNNYHSSLSPLKHTYESKESQIKLPIDNLLFDKLTESMNTQETQLSEWKIVLNKVSEFNNCTNIINNNIEDIQNSGNELIDLQISTLENLSHDAAPHVFNDNKTIHKISQILCERQVQLESEKINFDNELIICSKKREQFEKELEELTKKLSETRNNESILNNKLHEITTELTCTNEQLSIVNTMKNKITNNLYSMNELETH
eukprot:22559_1